MPERQELLQAGGGLQGGVQKHVGAGARPEPAPASGTHHARILRGARAGGGGTPADPCSSTPIAPIACRLTTVI